MLNPTASFIPNDLTPVFEQRNKVKQEISDLQKELKVIDNSITQQFENQARQILAEKGKDFGQATVKTDGFKVSIDFRKKVEWDHDKLALLFDSMDPETAKHYASVKISVSESKFQQAPPNIKASLSDCRTVLLQGTSLSIEADNG